MINDDESAVAVVTTTPGQISFSCIYVVNASFSSYEREL